MGQKDLNVLVIGTDEAIFNKDSELFQRVFACATQFNSLHVFCQKKGKEIPGSTGQGKLTVYPLPPFLPYRFWRAYRISILLLKGSQSWVVSAENPFLEGFLAFLLARFFSKPLHLQIHTDVFSPWYRRGSWKDRVKYWLAGFLIPRADCIRAVSERIKKSILGVWKSDFPSSRAEAVSVGEGPREVRLPQITVLPIFTDISKFVEVAPNSATEQRFKNYDFKMIAVGRFVDKEKNFSMLLDMMRDFVKICPQALLVLAGSGPDEGNYRTQITKYKLNGNIVLEGWREDLPSFYKSFDLYLMSSNFEGWGRTVIEALASGLPVVMTDVGLAGKIVKNGENGLVVPVDDKVAFLKAVENFYNDPVKRRQLASKGQDTVKNFTPRTYEEYQRLYKDSFGPCLLP